MSNRTITHEIKLHKSVQAVLWAMALSITLNALPQNTIISKALAEGLSGFVTVELCNGGTGRGITASCGRF